MSRDEIVRYLEREAGLSAQAAERAFEALARLVGERALLDARLPRDDPFGTGPVRPSALPSFPDEAGADEEASGPHGAGGGSEL